MLRYVMGSIGPMMGEYLMGAVITHRSQHSLLNFSAWPPFSKQQEYFCLPHQQDDFSTVFQSWVGLDTILYALKNSWCFASPKGFDSFSPGKCHCIQLFVYTGGLCQNKMHDGSKTSKR